MINLGLVLLTSCSWWALFKFLPKWGYFRQQSDKFPPYVNCLFKNCSCGILASSFLLALLIKLITGMITLPELADKNFLLAWPLDAFATAVLVTLLMRFADKKMGLIDDLDLMGSNDGTKSIKTPVKKSTAKKATATKSATVVKVNKTPKNNPTTKKTTVKKTAATNPDS